MGNADVASERPVRHVTIAKPFAVSVQEVSQGEFRLFCERTGRTCPAQPWSGDDYPVVEVTWADAHAYVEWLSKASGHPYRLPSEAEWEYAARAGHTGLFPSGDSLSPADVYYSATSTLTSPAPRSKHFNANDWHLLNMVGNVREWVEDSWSPNLETSPTDGSARADHDPHIGVVRGGAYADLKQKLRLSTREPLSRDSHDGLTGIRLVRVLD
jgi:formylglycine-generating enzyme required for sulfatase activity